MELRHLRYFVAVAECRSFKLAADTRLHTTQPSLSRQIGDLEKNVGTALLIRNPRGVELTAAGRVFLDHARLLLSQAQMAVQSARRAVDPGKPYFTVGFMIGHEASWLPAVIAALRDEAAQSHIVISTQNSPQLGEAVARGLIDAAILRRQDGSAELTYKLLIEETFEVYLPSTHRLAAREVIDPRDLCDDIFLSVSGLALSATGTQPALRRVIDQYLSHVGLDLRPSHEVDNLVGIMALIRATGGVAVLPAYARQFLPTDVITRPLQGPSPRIDLSLGYRPENGSPVLERLVSRMDDIIRRVTRPSTPSGA